MKMDGEENMKVSEMGKMKDCKKKRFDVIIGKDLKMEQNIVKVGKIVEVV